MPVISPLDGSTISPLPYRIKSTGQGSRASPTGVLRSLTLKERVQVFSVSGFCWKNGKKTKRMAVVPHGNGKTLEEAEAEV